MSAYTSGPWVRVEQDEPDRQLIEYEGNIELVQQSGFRIATVWRTPREDAEANARLIAAAPELLEALTEAVIALEIWHGMDLDDDTAKAAWELYQASPEMQKINAAIAKARGQEVES